MKKEEIFKTLENFSGISDDQEYACKALEEYQEERRKRKYLVYFLLNPLKSEKFEAHHFENAIVNMIKEHNFIKLLAIKPSLCFYYEGDENRPIITKIFNALKFDSSYKEHIDSILEIDITENAILHK